MKKFMALVLAALLLAATGSMALAERELLGNMYTEGFPVLEEKQTFTIAATKHASSLNGFAEKECVIETEALTNIHIEWLDVPASAWNEQVNIMLASGDMPDAFIGENVDVMSNLDLFTPIEEYIYAYAPNVVEMLENEPEILNAITAPDGHIYTLPNGAVSNTQSVQPVLWINPEWLEAVGMEMPETTEEFTEVLRAFKTQDPNGNGKADEIPLVVRQEEPTQWLFPLMGSFGAMDTPEHVYAKDGEVIFGAAQPEYYDAIAWFHELYTEGLIDQEAFTMDHAQLTAKGQSADLIIGAVMYWIPDAMDERFVDYRPVPALKGPDGTQMWIANNMPIGKMQGFSITTKCEDPATLVRYYDATMSSFEMIMLWKQGPKGAGGWKYVDEAAGTWATTKEFIPEGMSSEYFDRTVSASLYAPCYIWSKYMDLAIEAPRAQGKAAANEMYLPFCVSSMPNGMDEPERMTQRQLLFVDIDNYIKQFFATSVVNGLDEAGWANHLANLEKLQVGEYTELWQAYYDMVTRAK